MTREEAIERFNGIINAMSISVAQSKFYPSKAELNELCDMAIEALQFAEHFVLLKEHEQLQKVVRCKDCRHGEHIQIPLWENRDIDKAPSQFHDFIKCHKFHIKGFNETLYLDDDDFCSYGERREP